MKPHIQSFRSLIDEMTDVASGKRKPVHRLSKRVFESERAAGNFSDQATAAESRKLEVASIESVVRLLTVENQQLVKVIARGQAESVAHLAEITKRAESNVTRTLKKFVNLGLVVLSSGAGRKKVPHLTMNSIAFKVDFATGKVVVLDASARESENQSAMAPREPVSRRRALREAR